MEETTTIFFKRHTETNFIEQHTGMHTLSPAGVVLWHHKASQTFVPWHNVMRIEQTLDSSLPPHEVHNRRLSTRMHASCLTP